MFNTLLLAAHLFFYGHYQSIFCSRENLMTRQYIEKVTDICIDYTDTSGYITLNKDTVLLSDYRSPRKDQLEFYYKYKGNEGIATVILKDNQVAAIKFAESFSFNIGTFYILEERFL